MSGYIPKTSSNAVILSAVNLVMSGGVLAGEVDARNTSQEEILTLAAKYV